MFRERDEVEIRELTLTQILDIIQIKLSNLIIIIIITEMLILLILVEDGEADADLSIQLMLVTFLRMIKMLVVPFKM